MCGIRIRFEALRRTVFCLLLALSGSGCSLPGEVDPKAASSPEDWKLVEAYLELDRAWHAREQEIREMNLPDAQKASLRRDTRGAPPDVALAALAAMRLVREEGPHALRAAEFLVGHTRASPTRKDNIALGLASLVRHVGPDWSRVPAYLREMGAWQDAMHAIAVSEVSEREKLRLQSQLDKPKMFHACAAALAILDQGTDHPRVLEAAEFLLTEAAGEIGADFLVSRAAIALSVHFPHYGDWPRMLEAMARVQPPRDEIDAFIKSMAERAPDPHVRALAGALLANP